MHAPQRSDEEIVAEALELINPPTGQSEATRREIFSNLDRIRVFAQRWNRRQSPSEQKRQLEPYLKNLLATKRTFPRIWCQPKHEEFLTHLNSEIERIESTYDFRVRTRPKASKHWDEIAFRAAAAAGASIPAERLMLTKEGPWHRLSMLFYEAVTGKSDCDHVWKYMTVLRSPCAHPERFRGW
jgi:hypothetical protein